MLKSFWKMEYAFFWIPNNFLNIEIGINRRRQGAKFRSYTNDAVSEWLELMDFVHFVMSATKISDMTRWIDLSTKFLAIYDS